MLRSTLSFIELILYIHYTYMSTSVTNNTIYIMYKYQDYDSVFLTTTLFTPGNIDLMLKHYMVVIIDWLTKHISKTIL